MLIYSCVGLIGGSMTSGEESCFPCFALQSAMIFVYGHFELPTELHETWTFLICTKCWIEIEKWHATATTTTKILIHDEHKNDLLHNVMRASKWTAFAMISFFSFNFILLRHWACYSIGSRACKQNSAKFTWLNWNTEHWTLSK